MGALTVLLAARSTTGHAVRSALQDWSALGLLGELIWIWDDEVGDSFATAPADLLIAGASERAPLQGHLAQSRNGRLRLCVLSSLGGAPALVPLARAARLQVELSHGAAGGSPIHCILTRHGRGGWDDAAIWDQWHNAVIAPEDSLAPGSWPSRQVFPAGAGAGAGAAAGDAEFALHAAASVAGAVGLWRAVEQGAFDQRSVPGGPMATVTRCHLRVLDTSEVTRALQDGFADLGGEFPRPVVNGRQLDYLDSPVEACEQVAAAVVARHPELFVPTREPAAVPSTIQVGAWLMIRQYFVFLWAVLRSAPQEWVQAVATRAASSVAKRVQQLTVGNARSRYEVIVAGVGPDGVRHDPRDLADAAEALSAAAGPQAWSETTVPSLTGFWQDVLAGAFTLTDGTAHLSGVPCPTQDGRPGLLRRPSQLTPDNADVFETEQHLASHTVPSVAPHDVRTARLLHQALDRAGSQGGPSAHGAAAERDRLRQWFEGLSKTYTMQIGRKIDDQLHRSLTELIGMLHQLQAPELADESQQQLGRTTGGLVRRIRRRLYLALVLIVPAVALGVAGVIPWLVPVVVAPLVLALWLLWCGSSFVRSAQADFARACAQQPGEAASKLIARNIRHAAREVYLLSVAYSQYLCWAPVLSTFVADPLGQPAVGADASPRLTGALALSMRLGRAVPEPDEVSRLTDLARAEVLQPGWLGRAWEQVLARATAQLGPAGRRLTGPEALLRDRTLDPDSPLARWRDVVLEQGVDPAAARGLWDDARAAMVRPGSGALAGLFSRVRTTGHNGRPVLETGEQFLTDLVGPLERPRAFDRELFTPAALSQSAVTVQSTTVIAEAELLALVGTGVSAGVRRLEPAPRRDAGLDQFVVVVETGPALPGRGSLRLSGPPVPLLLPEPVRAAEPAGLPDIQETF